ncbi:uncharacterized protein LOC118455244 [Neolamprologus brichardi]|uniref:uncharacterized protein LOC118455244 n=1 Tax=Neolamprologus brichardi TaxID=32507 RepID=UPI001643D554|nr:uncharacterized protein LOC118455244 [Neolamprologus brichardi]
MIIWVGLAVGGSILVSFNWWENYLKKTISANSSPTFLENLCNDIKECQNILHILSSLMRIVVTACVVGAYVPLAKMDWSILTSIPSHETRIIAIIIGVQLVSSALCHWFALVACKMHALRRCFILPLYLASLAVLALLVIPVIVYYQDYRTSLNGTTNINFTDYCKVAVDGRNQSLNDSVFPHLVLDVTYTLCFLDMSKIADIGILTGSAVCWWIGFVLVTLHLWKLNVHRIERTVKMDTTLKHDKYLAGSLTFVLDINSAAALVISVIPPAIYLGLCFKLKSDTQITIAAILSLCYAFLMLTVTISIIGSMLEEKTILTPSSIFIIFMAILYLITAAMHPQEFPLVFHGFLYIICIPSAYLLLTIYSMVNMNNVSWGTRETKPAAGAAPPPTLTPQTRAQKAKSICQWLVSWIKCCKKSSQRFQGEQLSRSQDNTAQEPEQLEPEPQNTIVEDITITEEEQGKLD